MGKLWGTYLHQSWKGFEWWDSWRKLQVLLYRLLNGVLFSALYLRKNHAFIVSWSDGFKFYRSANNVILCPGNEEGFLPPCYFQRVFQIKQSKFSVLLQTSPSTKYTVYCYLDPTQNIRLFFVPSIFRFTFVMEVKKIISH